MKGRWSKSLNKKDVSVVKRKTVNVQSQIVGSVLSVTSGHSVAQKIVQRKTVNGKRRKQENTRK